MGVSSACPKNLRGLALRVGIRGSRDEPPSQTHTSSGAAHAAGAPLPLPPRAVPPFEGQQGNDLA